MSEFLRICGTGELPVEGMAREFAAGARLVCVANVHGEFAAMGNVCPHRGGPLGQGVVEDGKVVCPWHGWAFDAKTGVSTHSAQAMVEVFELKIEGGDVLVKIG